MVLHRVKVLERATLSSLNSKRLQKILICRSFSIYQGRSDWGVRLETRGEKRLRRGLGFLCSNAAYHKSSSGTSCSWSKMQEGQRALAARRRAHITGSVMEREIYDLERGKERQTSIDVSTTKIR